MKLEQMSIKELAALLGVSTDTIRRAARSNSFHQAGKAQPIVLTGRKSVRR